MSALRMGARAALGLASLVWWAPSLVTVLVAYGAGWLAFALLRAWIRILVEVGARDLACRTIERAMRRYDARAREMQGRQG